MKKTLTALIVGSLMCMSWALAQTSPPVPGTSQAQRISLYEVPLVCPAAPQIGCGSRSKPILLALEQQAGVAEAWLNRSGTMIAIVWKPEARRKARTSAFKAVSEKEGFHARELNGAAKKKALKDFLSGQGWFRGREVDRLSEEEAGIIAGRLVRRIQAKVTVTDETAKALRTEIADVFNRRFTGDQADTEPNLEAQLLKVLRAHLNEIDVARLQETLPRNLRPSPGEK